MPYDPNATIDPELLIEYLTNPENAEALSQLGVADERYRALDKRQPLAEGLMATPSAQGREVGRTYVAASPLEHLSTVLQRGLGAMQMGNINSQRDALATGNAGAAKALAKAMKDAMQARQASSPLSSQVGPGEVGYDAFGGMDDPSNYG